jgi:hypothetical protein
LQMSCDKGQNINLTFVDHNGRSVQEVF